MDIICTVKFAIIRLKYSGIYLLTTLQIKYWTQWILFICVGTNGPCSSKRPYLTMWWKNKIYSLMIIFHQWNIIFKLPAEADQHCMCACDLVYLWPTHCKFVYKGPSTKNTTRPRPSIIRVRHFQETAFEIKYLFCPTHMAKLYIRFMNYWKQFGMWTWF